MLRHIVHARNSYPLKGGSFIGKVGSFFKKANNFLRKSKVLSLAGAAGSAFYPALAAPTAAARALGYGRRRRYRRGGRRIGRPCRMR